ncbi:SRPBCC family protein [Microbacterium schleiferi]|uniref:SRPBCC family protein n=1 Tax=Microbacterium schleiferi TaxID=69362 RepID=UPI00311D7209
MTDQHTPAAGAEPEAARTVVVERLVSASREVVFEAFTSVDHLSAWWGPDGFTTSTREFEFREGGEWIFTMHGPDGTDYAEWIRWREIVAPERIVLLHGEYAGDPNAFDSVFTFDEVGAQTRVTLSTVFPTKQLRDTAVEEYHAIEGGAQTLGNLATYVEG